MIKRTRDEWKALVEQWKVSGKTITAWCHEHHIPKHFYLLDKRKSFQKNSSR